MSCAAPLAKSEFVSDVTETENDDGSTTKKTTISQRIELVVRTVDGTGRIQILHGDGCRRCSAE